MKIPSIKIHIDQRHTTFLVGFSFQYILLAFSLEYYSDVSFSICIVLSFIGSMYFFCSFPCKEKGMLLSLFYFIITMVWVVTLFAIIYKYNGIIDSNCLPPSCSPSSFTYFYLSVATFTTGGYGDITPTIISKPWASIEMIMGPLLYGVLAFKLGFLFYDKRLCCDETKEEKATTKLSGDFSETSKKVLETCTLHVKE